MEFQEVVEAAGSVVDGAGVVAILVGALAAVTIAAPRLLRRERGVYGRFRRFLGRSILLGLELLVAADIVGTVAVEATLDNLAVLAVIVLIRTFLSMSLTVEVENRWPWQPEGRGRSARREPGGEAGA